MLHSICFSAFGGINSVSVDDCSSQCDVRAILNEAKFEALRIQAKYSRYSKDSVITKINLDAGKRSTKIDTETEEILRFASEAFDLSYGYFDITSGVLRKAWDFKSTSLPDPNLVSSLKEYIGFDKVYLGAGEVYLAMPQMELDFGGLGKEYAVDRVKAILLARGVGSALINFAGDICAIGSHPSGRQWQVGIQHPRERRAGFASTTLGNCALATSGDYEKYIEVAGKRYCHLLNPFTGFPEHNIFSASVWANSCLIAGVIASTLMTMHSEQLKIFMPEIPYKTLIFFANEKVEEREHEVEGVRFVA